MYDIFVDFWFYFLSPAIIMEKLIDKTEWKMSFEDIKRKPGKLESLRSWDMSFIKMLLERGSVIETISNDDADNMPYFYEINWMTISYIIGWAWFETPFFKNKMFIVKNKNEFDIALDAIKCLIEQNKKNGQKYVCDSFSS